MTNPAAGPHEPPASGTSQAVEHFLWRRSSRPFWPPSTNQSGRLAEAATLYGRILEADPEQPDAAQLLGVLQAQTGRPAEGARLLRRALALRPVSAGAQSNLAGALQTMGDAAAAEAGYA
ncbi:tetratricopeptide repeat protein, partial [Azospirillum brasilense]|uniref:tetratricopeptide repeat protein n=1 Tax=Azospirillum brasilense TaxID=192 RepID=UPI0020004B94